MKDKEMLSSIYKNARMGVVGISAVEKYAESSDMMKELKNQKREYFDICRSAERLSQRKHSKLKELSKASERGAKIMSRVKLYTDRSDSKIASMMISGSVTGISKIIRSKHNYEGSDDRVRDLSSKLLLTEQNNIESMKSFL